MSPIIAPEKELTKSVSESGIKWLDRVAKEVTVGAKPLGAAAAGRGRCQRGGVGGGRGGGRGQGPALGRAPPGRGGGTRRLRPRARCRPLLQSGCALLTGRSEGAHSRTHSRSLLLGRQGGSSDRSLRLRRGSRHGAARACPPAGPNAWRRALRRASGDAARRGGAAGRRARARGDGAALGLRQRTLDRLPRTLPARAGHRPRGCPAGSPTAFFVSERAIRSGSLRCQPRRGCRGRCSASSCGARRSTQDRAVVV
jgi:hypothetical protein